MFTSKELYMMNGGNKLYLYKDGFGDVYQASAEEEAEWSAEVVAKALQQLDTEENAVSLANAIDNLQFHKHPGLTDLLKSKMQNTSAARQLTIGKELEKIIKRENKV